jgi:hypothetical protein
MFLHLRLLKSESGEGLTGTWVSAFFFCAVATKELMQSSSIRKYFMIFLIRRSIYKRNGCLKAQLENR